MSDGRPGYGLGCLAVVVGALLGLYWLSPLHDPENTGQARAESARRAQALEDALQADFSSPLGKSNRSSEPVLDRVADRFGGTLIAVTSQTSSKRRDFGVLVSLPGTASPKFSIGSRESTHVLACYEYSWQGYVYTIKHRAVDCPKGLPGPSDGRRQGAPETELLASRMVQQGAWMTGSSPSVAEAIAGMLRKAHVGSGVPRSIAVKNGIAAFAVGSPHSCVYGAIAQAGLDAWRAPWGDPCTADAAYKGYAITQWPPLGEIH
ncbi:MAG: hypothetical protein HOY69_21995 [Streptomyces sp.]|nr:hypothetical protein [Streptomyces sp.]